MSADHISFEDRNVSWKENDRIQFDNNNITKVLYCPSKLCILKINARIVYESESVWSMLDKVQVI